jgi:DNA-binding LacI/PurR family transcriptional regulator
MSLEEVAKRSGVSTATVSRVLNGVDVVKNSTRSRVMKAITELKYHPNLHARSLAGGRSKTIGVIVSNLDNPFFLDVYRAVESDCHAHGFEVLVANTAYSSEQLVASIRLMIGRRVAGLAAIVSEMEDAIVQELTESRIPIVFYDVGTAGGNITKIRVNYRKGVERIVEYLAALGHERLAFIGHHAVLGPIDERRQALFDTVKVVCPHASVRVAADSDSLDGGNSLRERCDGGRRAEGIARAWTAGAGGCLGHRFRQYQALGVLLSGSDNGPYSAGQDRAYLVHQSGPAGCGYGQYPGERVRHRPGVCGAGFDRTGAEELV